MLIQLYFVLLSLQMQLVCFLLRMVGVGRAGYRTLGTERWVQSAGYRALGTERFPLVDAKVNAQSGCTQTLDHQWCTQTLDEQWMHTNVDAHKRWIVNGARKRWVNGGYRTLGTER